MKEFEKYYQIQSKTERDRSISNQDNVHSNEKDILQDYIIGETLGKGTFSKVKLGTHKITKEKVNLKFKIIYNNNNIGCAKIC